VGHSIGLLVHDWPLLRAGDDTVLQPGMTLQIEHGLPDGEGYRFSIEDLVLVTEGAPSMLSDDSCWQELAVIPV
jgi:Xaa-Pro aminopeptidase